MICGVLTFIGGIAVFLLLWEVALVVHEVAKQREWW